MNYLSTLLLRERFSCILLNAGSLVLFWMYVTCFFCVRVMSGVDLFSEVILNDAVRNTE